jgi:hypothetical protein
VRNKHSVRPVGLKLLMMKKTSVTFTSPVVYAEVAIQILECTRIKSKPRNGSPDPRRWIGRVRDIA